MLLHELLEEHAGKNPDSEAIVFHDRRVSYGEYLENVNRAAAAMRRLGVKRGDNVAMYQSNTPEFVFCYIAAASLGAAAVPVSWRFSVSEVRFIVGNSNSSFMVAQPGFSGVDFLDIVNQIKPECPDLKTVVVLGTAEEVARVPGAVSGDELSREVEPEDVAALEIARVEVQEGDTAFMIYTSGTTGIPKGVMLTHRNLIAYTKGQIEASNVTSADRLLLDIPVNHVGGGVMAIVSVLYRGATLVMLDQFIPKEVLETIQDEKITVMGQVPAQYILLTMDPDFDSYDLSSIRIAVVSSAPCPNELFEQIKEKFGVYMTNGYGLSEVSGAITFNRVDEDSFERFSTSIGAPNPGIEVRIKDVEGNDLPVAEEGEICIKGDAVMKGYYNMPDETAHVTTGDGFFRSGDMGRLDDDGYVYILGRKKEMYIRGGENVYPPEVEDVIQENPGVLFVAVLGIPDPVMGEVGRAYIVPMPGAEPPTEDGIKQWCKERLANFKMPTEVVFRDSLPLTPLGKVMKKALYEEM